MLLLAVSASSCFGMEQSGTHAIVLAGQNGGGNFYHDGILPKDFTEYKIIGYNTTGKYDRLNIDLGQGNCIRSFEEQLETDPNAKGKKLVLFGSSQGTATLLNWLATKSPEDQNKLIAGITLQAVLGTGNRAILHTVEECISSKVTYLPFARAWLPWIAKGLYPTYNPFGKSVLGSANKISKDIPIMILHHVKDFQLSINDARELYCKLRENGNNNAYLMEVNHGVPMHTEILQGFRFPQQRQAAIHAFYKKYNLPYSQEFDTNNVDLSPLQPDVAEVKQKIYESTWKKRYIRNTIDTIATVGIVAYLYKKFWA
jgi:hypothetical protein